MAIAANETEAKSVSLKGPEAYLRSCSILNKLVSAALRAAETSIYRSRAPRANGKCERCKI
jgi:hypothetical protein